MVKVEVILDKWGNYKKGDTLELHQSTAKGCIANKAVKLFKKPTTKKPSAKN